MRMPSMYKNPSRLSDDDLEKEYQAITPMLEDILPSDKVSEFIKQQTIEHCQAVITEYSLRHEGQCAVPEIMQDVIPF